MVNRTTKSYNEMLQILKNKNPNFNPHSIIIDFEKSFVIAIIEEFPLTKIKGCFFFIFNTAYGGKSKEMVYRLYTPKIWISLYKYECTTFDCFGICTNKLGYQLF